MFSSKFCVKSFCYANISFENNKIILYTLCIANFYRKYRYILCLMSRSSYKTTKIFTK